MPRRARLSIAGIPWHIIQRGNNRSVCFYAEEDYLRYLETLRELARKFGCAVHAYVLMTNHVHLLLTPEREQGPGLLMKHLGQRYVQYVNRSYRRSGTLWEGRFRSCLTQREDYVLSCYRYIELNPVRANMVAHSRDYRWSSHRANAEGQPDSLLTPHEEYLRLGREEGSRQSAYRDLFNAHLDPERLGEIRQATNGNYALGNVVCPLFPISHANLQPPSMARSHTYRQTEKSTPPNTLFGAGFPQGPINRSVPFFRVDGPQPLANDGCRPYQ